MGSSGSDQEDAYSGLQKQIYSQEMFVASIFHLDSMKIESAYGW